MSTVQDLHQLVNPRAAGHVGQAQAGPRLVSLEHPDEPGQGRQVFGVEFLARRGDRARLPVLPVLHLPARRLLGAGHGSPTTRVDGVDAGLPLGGECS